MTDLTSGNIYKRFLTFGLPIVISGLISQAYGIINTAVAGRYLGEDGLAATGATSQFITMFSSVFWGLSMGFAVYIASLFGNKEYARLKNTVFNVLAMFALLEISLCGIILLLCGHIMEILNVDPHILSEARLYFVIYMSGIVFISFNNVFSKILNALGLSSFPVCMSVASGLLTCIGNVISVTVLGLGVEGLALSTVLITLAVDICYMIKLNKCFKEMGVSNNKVHFDFSVFRSVLRFSLPCCLQQTSMYFASTLMSPIINGIGSAATAGYSLAMRIYNINAGIYQSASTTLSNYTAQCSGAKKYDKIRKGLFVGLIQGIIFVLPFVLTCSIFAESVISLFLPDDFIGKSFDYAVMFSRVYLPFILFNFINNLFHSFFRGIGEMRYLLISTILGSVIMIGFGMICGRVYGLEGVFFGLVVSWIGEALFMLLVYIFKFRNSEMIKKAAQKNFSE